MFLGRVHLTGAMPGQKLVNSVDGVIGDVGQYMAQPGFGIDPVELGRPDQRVRGGGMFAASVGTGELRYPDFFGHSCLVNFANGRFYETNKNIYAGASCTSLDEASSLARRHQ